MTTKQLSPLLNAQGTIFQKGLAVRVIIKDVRRTYGVTQYLVTPVSGRGERWMNEVLELSSDIN